MEAFFTFSAGGVPWHFFMKEMSLGWTKVEKHRCRFTVAKEFDFKCGAWYCCCSERKLVWSTWAKKPFLERLAYRNLFHIRATNCCLFRLQPVTWCDPLPSEHFNQSVSLHSAERSHHFELLPSVWSRFQNQRICCTSISIRLIAVLAIVFC